MPTDNTRKLAQLGQPKAIADLINHSLASQSIRVSVKNNNGCLEIIAKSQKVADQSMFLDIMKRGLSNLKPDNVSQVIISFIQEGEASYAWRSSFRIEDNYTLIDIPQTSELRNAKSKSTRKGLNPQPLHKKSSAVTSSETEKTEVNNSQIRNYVVILRSQCMRSFEHIKSQLSLLSKTHKLILFSSLLAMIGASVTYYELTRERICKINGVSALEVGQQYHDRWRDTDELASQTARIDLASQINRLQDLKSEIQYSGWPDCAQPIGLALTTLIQARISNFSDFMAGGEVDSMEARASVSLKINYQIGYAKSLMDVATAQEKERLKHYQGGAFHFGDEYKYSLGTK